MPQPAMVIQLDCTDARHTEDTPWLAPETAAPPRDYRLAIDQASSGSTLWKSKRINAAMKFMGICGEFTLW